MTNRSHWHSCTAAVAHEQGKEWAPPATLWSERSVLPPAIHSCISAQHMVMLFWSVCYGVGDGEERQPLLMLTCYEKQFWHEYLLWYFCKKKKKRQMVL